MSKSSRQQRKPAAAKKAGHPATQKVRLDPSVAQASAASAHTPSAAASVPQSAPLRILPAKAPGREKVKLEPLAAGAAQSFAAGELEALMSAQGLHDAAEKWREFLAGRGLEVSVTQQASTNATFDLDVFEALCYSRRHEEAVAKLVELLTGLDAHYGHFGDWFVATCPGFLRNDTDHDTHLMNRLCAALAALLTDPGLAPLPPQQYGAVFHAQRFLAALFYASSYGNTDHMLRVLGMAGENGEARVNAQNIFLFCLIYTMNSGLPVNFDALWRVNKDITAAMAATLLAARFCGTELADQKRDLLLRWLPGKLEEVDDLSVLPQNVLHDVYMHCSYADFYGKHAVKIGINKLIRKKLLQLGVKDVAVPPKPRGGSQKPVLLVILDWMNAGHAMYRCYAPMLLAARARFHTVGVGMASAIDEAGRAVFDEFVPIEKSGGLDAAREARAVAVRVAPAAVYYPSIGMMPLTLFASTLRLAPIQVVSPGHPASSCSPAIDYFAADEGYLGDPACYTEKILVLPFGSASFLPHHDFTETMEPVLRERPDVVRVLVTASSMKLSFPFLQTCREISRRAASPVEFHIMVGASDGLPYLEAAKAIKRILPDARINAAQKYDAYLREASKCDLFINPFPFGNTNGNLDTFSLGMAGVCKTGMEGHSRIDAGMFRVVGMPEWLIARDNEEYIAAAVRLIDDHELRLALRRQMIAEQRHKVFFEGGQPDALWLRLEELLDAQA